MRRPLDGSPQITTKHGTWGMGYFGQHIGTDYGVGRGTRVLAPASGVVRSISYGGASGANAGYWLEVEAEGKWRRFGHLQAVHVAVGQRFTEGQHIGDSGATSGYPGAGAHLHYDVRKIGTAWNQAFTYYDDPEIELSQSVKPASGVPKVDSSVVGRVLYLKPHVAKWRVYHVNQQPLIGKEIYFLSPATYGGLSYRIEQVAPFPQTVRIVTRDRGLVNIYVDGDAEIR